MKNILWKIFGFSITGTLIAKAILAVIVVLLNYIFSKFIIFKKKPQKEQNNKTVEQKTEVNNIENQ